MADIIRIAVDGPCGAGKSTIAKKVARAVGAEYVDTGAMYRAVGYKMRKLGAAPEDTDRIEAILNDTEIDFRSGVIYLDGEDVSGLIRTPEISEAASVYSALPPVRRKLVEIQRQIGHRRSVVMDGRDIGTNVFPDAQYKFYLTADAEERARRRWKELKEKGQDVELSQILQDIHQRDYADTHRELNPLMQAEDAELVDSTSMTIDEVVKTLVDKIQGGVSGRV